MAGIRYRRLLSASILLWGLIVLHQPARADVGVAGDHPRLFLRPDVVAGLRERCHNDPHLKPVYENLRAFAYSDARNTNLWVAPNELCSIALACLLEDGDPRLLARARGHIDFLCTVDGDSWTRPIMLKSLACAYDWLHGYLSEGERQSMADRIVELAGQMRRQYRHSDYNNHVYLERGPIVYLGLALAGDGLVDEEASRALQESEDLLRQHFIPTVNQVGAYGDGGWHESMSYWSFFVHEFVHQLEAWRTATGENLFAECSGLEGAARWLVYCTRPHDDTMAPVADIESPYRWGDQESVYLPLIAARYGNGLAQWCARKTPPRYAARGWAYLVGYDPNVAAAAPSPLPTGTLFSGIGWAAMRSDWTEDATWALFTCGDYYAGHQHFDQNSFLISKRGNLAIDAGEYGAKETLFHNTILIGTGQRRYGNDPRTRYGMIPSGSEFDTGEIVAFEENEYFTYVVGSASNAYGEFRDGQRTEKAPVFVRRFLFLKPDTFVVDDLVRPVEPDAKVCWLLHSHEEPAIPGREILLEHDEGQLTCRTLLPEQVDIAAIPDTGGRRNRAHYRIEVAPRGKTTKEVRFLHVLHARAAGNRESQAQCEWAAVEDELRLTVTASGRRYRLDLPLHSPGQIAIADGDGKELVPERVLASGILPYSADGVRLLDRWDGTYRGGARPGWDTGRVSSNLKRAVEEKLVEPCRAAVLGCGTGTNAVYLAGKGFDVTGIDLAPTALSRARSKAEQAGVDVKWLLADVTRIPELEPYDFLFDRGCYHGVRRTDAAGYVETLRKLTKPGSRILILAGNANEDRQYGPPRVKEEEIRGDFASDFRIAQLRETHFDGRRPNSSGALAWLIVLERK